MTEYYLWVVLDDLEKVPKRWGKDLEIIKQVAVVDDSRPILAITTRDISREAASALLRGLFFSNNVVKIVCTPEPGLGLG